MSLIETLPLQVETNENTLFYTISFYGYITINNIRQLRIIIKFSEVFGIAVHHVHSSCKNMITIIIIALTIILNIQFNLI